LVVVTALFAASIFGNFEKSQTLSEVEGAKPGRHVTVSPDEGVPGSMEPPRLRGTAFPLVFKGLSVSY
jgi:hypothetical protein